MTSLSRTPVEGKNQELPLNMLNKRQDSHRPGFKSCVAMFQLHDKSLLLWASVAVSSHGDKSTFLGGFLSGFCRVMSCLVGGQGECAV